MEVFLRVLTCLRRGGLTFCFSVETYIIRRTGLEIQAQTVISPPPRLLCLAALHRKQNQR